MALESFSRRWRLLMEQAPNDPLGPRDEFFDVNPSACWDGPFELWWWMQGESGQSSRPSISTVYSEEG